MMMIDEAETLDIPKCPVTGRFIGEPTAGEVHMFAVAMMGDTVPDRKEARRLVIAAGLMSPAGMQEPRRAIPRVWVDVPMTSCERSQDLPELAPDDLLFVSWEPIDEQPGIRLV